MLLSTFLQGTNGRRIVFLWLLLVGFPEALVGYCGKQDDGLHGSLGLIHEGSFYSLTRICSCCIDFSSSQHPFLKSYSLTETRELVSPNNFRVITIGICCNITVTIWPWKHNPTGSCLFSSAPVIRLTWFLESMHSLHVPYTSLSNSSHLVCLVANTSIV